jgi:Polyketide cyclase / dehydrase and lipid transport
VAAARDVTTEVNDEAMTMTTIRFFPGLMPARSAALGLVLLGTTPAFAATISRSLEVKAQVADVWSVIGPFCAIKTWLPPVGQCIEDGKASPTRILVTKDGKAAFVETQTARSETEHSYSYKFLASPLPVSDYTATIKVTAKGDGSSVITWIGSYRPDEGKEKAADEALSGVYEAGLAEIRARFSK